MPKRDDATTAQSLIETIERLALQVEEQRKALRRALEEARVLRERIEEAERAKRR
jgi:hypothetical protein